MIEMEPNQKVELESALPQLIDVFGIGCNYCDRWFWIQAPQRIEDGKWIKCPICHRKLIGAVDDYIQLGAVDYVVMPAGPIWPLSGHDDQAGAAEK